MTSRIQLAVILAIAALLAIATTAARAQDAVNGARIAERWCSPCHATASQGSDAAPSFETIAGSPAGEPARLKRFLADPHPPMPPLQLTHQDVEDLVAFVARRRPK